MKWKSTEIIAALCAITFGIRLAFLSHYICDLGFCPSTSLWNTVTSLFESSPDWHELEDLEKRDIPLYLFYYDKNGNRIQPPARAIKLVVASLKKRANALLDIADYQMEELLTTMESISVAAREYEELTGRPLWLGRDVKKNEECVPADGGDPASDSNGKPACAPNDQSSLPEQETWRDPNRAAALKKRWKEYMSAVGYQA